MPDTWDIMIIGAGPAGGVAAAILAERGRRVLLVERAHWPREKTCGGCLNAFAVRELQRAGLQSVLAGAGAINGSVWHVGLPHLSLDAPGGAAISRSTLDARIVQRAVERGCTFISGASARLLPQQQGQAYRDVRLQVGKTPQTFRADMVLLCDGIAGAAASDEPWARWRVDRGSFIGVSATFERWAAGVEEGTIHMHIGTGGYAGAVRLADGRVHVGAAINPMICREMGGPISTIRRIFQECGYDDLFQLERPRFMAAGRLTRKRVHLGGRRVLAVGDACGYIEPFTGEGIGWAIAAAREAADLLGQNGGWSGDLPRQWERRHRQAIEKRQYCCRIFRPMMHHPALARAGSALIRYLPWAGSRLSRVVAG